MENYSIYLVLGKQLANQLKSFNNYCTVQYNCCNNYCTVYSGCFVLYFLKLSSDNFTGMDVACYCRSEILFLFYDCLGAPSVKFTNGKDVALDTENFKVICSAGCYPEPTFTLQHNGKMLTTNFNNGTVFTPFPKSRLAMLERILVMQPTHTEQRQRA